MNDFSLFYLEYSLANAATPRSHSV